MTRTGVTAELGLSAEDFKRGLREGRQASEVWKSDIIKIVGEVGQAFDQEFKDRRDLTLAAQMKAFRGETLSAKDDIRALAREYERMSAAAAKFTPIQRSITGLRTRRQAVPESGAPRPGPALTGSDLGFSDSSARSAASYDRLAQATSRANKELARTRGLATNSGMGMLMLSQTIDDAQYGLRGVVNNIAPLVMALGGGTGLAGAATIAAVAINQIAPALEKTFNNITGETAYQKMLKQGAEDMEVYAQKLERLRAESALGSQQRADLARRVAGYEDEAVRRQQEQHSLRMQQLDIEHQMQRSALIRLDAADREKAAHELSKKQMAERVNEEARFAEEQMRNLKNRMGLDNYNRSAAERTLTGLRAELDQLNLRPENSLGEPARRRKAALPGLIDAARTDVESEQGRFRSLNERLRSARDKQSLLPKDLARLNQDYEDQQREAMKRSAREWVESLQGMKLRMNEWSLEMNRVLLTVRQELALRRESLRRVGKDAEIAHLRATGHNARADRMESKENEARRIKDLMDQGMPADQAKALAQQETRDRKGRVGRRLGPTPRTPSPLDEDRTARGYRPPETPNLDDARNRRNSRLAPRKDEKPGILDTASNLLNNGFKILAGKLDDIKTAVQGPVGDKLRPINQ